MLPGNLPAVGAEAHPFWAGLAFAASLDEVLQTTTRCRQQPCSHEVSAAAVRCRHSRLYLDARML